MRTQEMEMPKALQPLKVYPNQWGNKHGYLKSRKRTEWQLIGVIAADWLMFNAALTGAWLLKSNPAEQTPEQLTSLFWFLGVSNIVAILVAAYTNTYHLFEGVKILLKIKDLVWSSIILFSTISLLYYPYFYRGLGVDFILEAFLFFLFASTIVHLSVRYFPGNRRSYMTYAVIGGSYKRLRILNQEMSFVYGPNSFCLGRFSDEGLPGTPSLGGYDQIVDYLDSHNNINKLLYLDSPLGQTEIRELDRLCRSRFIEFEIVLDEFELFEKGAQFQQIASLPVLRRKREPLKLLKNRILKRVFDIVFSLFVILFIFPIVIPIVAILIKLESKGPIFFIQPRTGYWNNHFNCFKFRSMKMNKEANEKQATKGDSRMTKIGTFLRKTNLDELPQFINVLKGEMSVVGPRPHMLKHTDTYSQLIDRFMVRHEVKPGITGWAQVNGWRGPTDELYKMKKRVEFDVYYIENWSLWFDLTCIFLTVANVFRGEENAF